MSGPVDAEWKDLRAAVAKAWSQSREVANWFLDELYAADIRRQPGVEKMAAMPKNYLYPKARERFPDYPSALLVAIEHAVAGKYRAARYKLLWTGETSLPAYRYPVPYPVAGQNWKAKTIDERPCVRVSIAGQPFTLRLRGGKEFARQLAAFRKIESGAAVQGELSLYRRKARENDGRNGIKTNEPGRPMWQIMCKLVAWLPRVERTRPEKSRFFNLRTDAECFLYGVLEDREEPWIVNADKVRDWAAQHQRWLNRQAEDTKHEGRRPKRRKRKLLADYDAHASKYRDRMKSFIQETCAHVAGFAVRNGVNRIKLDTSYQDYVTSFPWFQLRQQLATKLDECGIELDNANGDGAAKTAGPLANGESLEEST